MRNAMPLFNFSRFPCRSLAVTCNKEIQKKMMPNKHRKTVTVTVYLTANTVGIIVTYLKDQKTNIKPLHFWARWCVVQTLWLNWWQTSCSRADCEQCGTAGQEAASTGCGWLMGAAWKAAEMPQSGVPCQAHSSYPPCHQSESALDTADKKIISKKQGDTIIFFSWLYIHLNIILS